MKPDDPTIRKCRSFAEFKEDLQEDEETESDQRQELIEEIVEKVLESIDEDQWSLKNRISLIEKFLVSKGVGFSEEIKNIDTLLIQFERKFMARLKAHEDTAKITFQYGELIDTMNQKISSLETFIRDHLYKRE